MDPQWIIAACAAVTLLILWTSSIATSIVWLTRKLDGAKAEILADSKAKHEENRIRIDAMQHMLIRHDTILEPEFNGTGGRHGRAGRQ